MKYLKISGKTETGKIVVGGVFQMYDTSGMPLPILFSSMAINNMVPDVIDFYKEAVKSNWSLKTIFDRLEEAYLDGYSKEFWSEVKKRLQWYIMNEKI